jgi:trimethylamine:corrinoid methyltransferase-like protein
VVWRARLEEHVPPPIDAGVERDVDAYIAARTLELG